MKYKRAAKVYVEVLNGKHPSNQRFQRVPRNIFLFEFFVESWMKFVVSWSTKKRERTGKGRNRKKTSFSFGGKSELFSYFQTVAVASRESYLIGLGWHTKGCLQHGNWDRGFKASTAGRSHTAGEVNCCRRSQGQSRGSPFYAKVVCRVMRRNYGNLELFSLKRIWIMHFSTIDFSFFAVFCVNLDCVGLWQFFQESSEENLFYATAVGGGVEVFLNFPFAFD